MSQITRVLVGRFIGFRAVNRLKFSPHFRTLSSESNDETSSGKKPGIASLLSSLKQANKNEKHASGDIASYLKRERRYPSDEVLNEVDEEVMRRKRKDVREAVMESHRKLVAAKGKVVVDDKSEKPSTESETIEVSFTTEEPESKTTQEDKPDVDLQDARETGFALKSTNKKVKSDPELDSKLKSILSQLKVDTSKHKLSKDIIGAVQSWGKKHARYRGDIEKDYTQQLKPHTKPVKPVSLTTGERFTVFDDIFESKNVLEVPEKLFLTEQETIDALTSLKTLDYRNDFERLIEIADRQWKFPVNNEVCKVEEMGVGFEEHVFLGYLLDDFPKKGPVRQFMELVICGLEQNPHMTAEQKKERVVWFKDYFDNVPKEELVF